MTVYVLEQSPLYESGQGTIGVFSTPELAKAYHRDRPSSSPYPRDTNWTGNNRDGWESGDDWYITPTKVDAP